MDQLAMMKELKGDELVTSDRRPARMKLENQPFTWLPKWMEMLRKIKTLCVEDEQVLIDVAMLKQLVTEYKSDDERRQCLEDFYNMLDSNLFSSSGAGSYGGFFSSSSYEGGLFGGVDPSDDSSSL